MERENKTYSNSNGVFPPYAPEILKFNSKLFVIVVHHGK